MLPLQRILVGVDGSTDADRALRYAIGLARALDAEVLAVHAVTLLAHLGPGPAVPSEQHLDEIRRKFDEEWCRPLLDAGTTITTGTDGAGAAPARGGAGTPAGRGGAGVAFRRILMPGEPVTTLLRLAEQREVGLIVVGRRGVGGSPQLLLGSTSHQLTQHAPCPVLVVPAG